MSEFWKVSGKRVRVPEPKTAGAWKFQPRPGGWIIAIGPEGERRRLLAQESLGRLSVSAGGRLWHGEISRVQAGESGVAVGDGDLIAQFPGKVRKVLVSEGSTVAEGAPLVLVEAMKMEFAVKAPFAGVVAKILVKEGQQLAPGDRFVEMKNGAD